MAELYFPRKSGGVITAYYDDGDPVVEPLAAAGLLSLCSHRHGEMYVAMRERRGLEMCKVSLARIMLGIENEGPKRIALFLDGDTMNLRRANLAIGRANGNKPTRRLPVAERVILAPTKHRRMTVAEQAIAEAHRQRIADTIGADVLAAWMAQVGAR